MSSDEILQDFGEVTREAVERVAQEFARRGYEKLEINDEDYAAASGVGRQFLRFLAQVFEAMGLIDRLGVAHPRIAVNIKTSEGQAQDELLRRLWNRRAHDWAVVETASTYAITFQTLLEFLKANDRKPHETITSLGSGPGLYETYLGVLLCQVPQAKGVRIVAVDFAREMTGRHREILKHLRLSDGSRITNVEPRTGDMLRLPFKDASIDQVICNNALQWTINWRKAIAEMERVMNPEGLGYLYLFVHAHPMVVHMPEGSFITLGEFTAPELLDELERRRFQILNTRQMSGRLGTGQAGGRLNRLFVRAQFQEHGKLHSWREAKMSAAIRGFPDGGIE
ncbi:MAG: class I SAM-dependent methyltransferase [Patescibacteria group bacterium]|nr:class I SAM-dependent methyltransferase [Patescibacteria group bacterium]